MTVSLDKLRETIQQNRATNNIAQSTPEKTVFVNPKGELLVGGEVVEGTAEELSVVQQGTFAA